MKKVNFKNILILLFSSLLFSCTAEMVENAEDDNATLLSPGDGIVAISSVKIDGEKSKAMPFTKSRDLSQSQMVEGFIADDIIRLDVLFNDGNSGVYTYKYTVAEVWQFLGEDMLFVSDLKDVKSVVAHFIPGIEAGDAYSWLSASTPWDGTGAYPDILVDKDVEIESDGLAIDFTHAVNGRLLVRLVAKDSANQPKLASANVELLSSMAMAYYTINGGVGTYAYDFFPSRKLVKVDSLDGDCFQILLTAISSYNFVFNIEVEGKNYRTSVYRADIAADYSATITVNVDIE